MNSIIFSMLHCSNRRRSWAVKALRLSLLFGCLAVLSVAVPAAPDSFIWIDVSIKVIVDPATGQVPATMNDELLRQSFTDMNRWLANTWRGYRLRTVDLDASGNFRRIGSTDRSGPSKWYPIDLKNDGVASEQFKNEAKANKSLYAWNDSAINIYFNNGDYSAAGDNLVISAYKLLIDDPAPGQMFARSYKVAGNLLHEIGHCFGLPHTFDSNGDDGFADTARDNPLVPLNGSRNETAVRDDIAQFNFKVNYSALTPDKRTRVDNTANNAMSYYQLFYDDPAQNKVLTDAERFGPTRFVFTEQQMDRWANIANNQRAVAVTGRTRFVSLDGSDSNTGLTHETPKRTALSAVNSSSPGGGDIILLRPGNYNELLTINKPVTLRATRAGLVTIGQP